MDGHRKAVPDAHDRADEVGSRTEVRVLAEVLRGVALSAHRIGVRILDHSADRDLVGLQIVLLALALGEDQGSLDNDRASGGQLENISVVLYGIGHDSLNWVEA